MADTKIAISLSLCFLSRTLLVHGSSNVVDVRLYEVESAVILFKRLELRHFSYDI